MIHNSNPLWYFFACPRYSRKAPIFSIRRCSVCFEDRLPRFLEKFASDSENEIYYITEDNDKHHAQKWMREIWESDRRTRDGQINIGKRT